MSGRHLQCLNSHFIEKKLAWAAVAYLLFYAANMQIKSDTVKPSLPFSTDMLFDSCSSQQRWKHLIILWRRWCEIHRSQFHSHNMLNLSNKANNVPSLRLNPQVCTIGGANESRGRDQKLLFDFWTVESDVGSVMTWIQPGIFKKNRNT